MAKKTVCVIGLGYIGLPTAAILANKGYVVSGVDTNEEIVSTINAGKIHIMETGLEALVKSAILSGRFEAFNEIQKSDVYIICVPTPFHNNKKIPQPNVDYVLSASKSIASYIKPGDLIILESTSPVGTIKKIQKMLIKNRINIKDVYIAYCPERVLPGKIITELIKNDRIVGGINLISTKKIVDFYRTFVKGDIFETDAKTAEMCKLAENSFRDLNIAFANEISIICHKHDINVWDLVKLANRHPRVDILQPGPGVGGHCIGVDPWFLISQDVENTKLLRTAREVNNYKTKWVINIIKEKAADHFLLTGIKPTVACLGLAFKADIDDLRESKALEIVENLLNEDYQINIVEPNILSHENLSLSNLSDSIKGSDIICVLVKHREFLEPKVKDELIRFGALDFCGALN